MNDTVLIANRGEIALRIIRTCKDMGLRAVAVYSEADADALFVQAADEAILLGPAPAGESYLRADRILEAAKRSGAGAIHPGYGFLSEQASFATGCAEAGIAFIGPSPEAIAAMGSKIEAKRRMAEHGVPVVPGFDGGDQSDAAFLEAADAVGFPLLVKASAGGGGKGMRLVRDRQALPEALAAARREASSAFGDPALLIERYIESPRHVEVQILGDHHGNVVHCFERECSIQRRHQKILEESPSPAVDPALREALGQAAVRAGQAIGYRSAGTVEFVLGADRSFYFLEVNTRLQVEHPVTECVTGLDLVRLQIAIAMGEPLPLSQADLTQRGAAIEARLYAEDPAAGFLPQTGTLAALHLHAGPGIRIDSGVTEGDTVGIHYDPMLAKIIAWGPTRAEANRRLQRCLERSHVAGVTTNLDLLARILAHPDWQAGAIDTHFIDRHAEALLTPTPDAALEGAAARIATALAALEDARGRAILPGLTPGWRNNPVADPTMRWRIGEAELRVSYRVLATGAVLTTVDGTPAEVFIHGVGANRHARLGDRQLPFRLGAAAPDLSRLSLRLSGATFDLARPDLFARERDEAAAGSCRAPMPGKVVAVRVSPGEEVTAGQPLIVLEAMKMEHTLEAPRDGQIKEVLCAVGDIVASDAELILLEG